jgi:hypothetical protein
LAAFGIDVAQPEQEDFSVWQDCWETLKLFLSLSTQWNFLATMEAAYRTGLNYSAVESAMRLKRVKNKAEMFELIQVMERAALDVFNEAS